MIKIIKPYGFIYITTNMINGKRYIGQRKFSKGWEWYLGSGKILKQAIIKDKKENFYKDIVAIGHSQEELDNLEIKWITNYNAVENDDFYNIADGGKGGNKFAGKNKSEMLNISKKMSEARLGKNNGMYGRKGKLNPRYGVKHTPEAKEKMHNKLKGRNFSNEHKTHLSESRIRKISRGEISVWNKGISHSIETIEKISNSLKGKYKDGNNPKARCVICLTSNICFDCLKKGAEWCGCSYSIISMCCNYKRKTAGKHPITGIKLQWRYIKDLTPKEYIKYDIENKLKELHNRELVQAI